MSDIMNQFKALKLQGMAECYAEIQTQGQSGTSEAIASTTWLISRRSHGSKYTGYTLSDEFR